jgi:replicative DNA helicase
MKDNPFDGPEPEYTDITTQPHSMKMEEALLGALLIDPVAIKRVDINADDFYSVRNSMIFSAIKDVKTVDYLTVTDKLEERGQLGEIGGAVYLMGLLNATPTSMHADEYANRIRTYSKRRRTIALANELARLAYSSTEKFDDELSSFSTNFYALSKEKSGASTHIKDALSKLYDTILEASEHPKDIWGMETGYRDWDKILGGHHKQEMILLSGDPGVGKSIFTTDLGFGMAKYGYPGNFYEMEMSGIQILNRKLSGFTGVEANKMKSGRIADGDWPLITNGIGEMESLPIFMSDKPSWRIAGLRADLLRLKEEHDIQWVVIDYLDYISDHQDLKRHDRLGENARSLKQISRELDVNMIVINSMNKDGERNQDPTTADMSGSAQLGFDCDLAVFIKKDKKIKDKNVVNVTFSKYREGDSNRILQLELKPGIPSFRELQRMP